MPKKYKYFLFALYLTAFTFLNADFCRALEVDLKLGANPSFPQYAAFLFSWGISIDGVVSVISFAVGAVFLIISGDSSEMATSGKSRMKSAVIGLVLTISAYAIANTINPQLTSFNFPEPTKLADWPQGTAPGVYFYDKADCSGDNSGAQAISIADISSTFSKPASGSTILSTKIIKGIKIINDPANDLYFGTVLHQSKLGSQSGGGLCSLPMFNRAGNMCIPIQNADSLNAVSADIFKITMDPVKSRDKLTFYSEPYGTPGSDAGYYEVLPTNFPVGSGKHYLTLTPSNMNFSWPIATKRNPAYRNRFKTFKDSPGSIIFSDKYLVALYSTASTSVFGTSVLPYCQTFTSNVPVLEKEPIAATGSYKNSPGEISANGLNKDIWIVPLKNE